MPIGQGRYLQWDMHASSTPVRVAGVPLPYEHLTGRHATTSPAGPGDGAERLPSSGPFSLHDEGAYRRWRERKLADYPLDPEALAVEIAHPDRLRESEVDALLERLRKVNMAVYVLDGTRTLSRRGLARFARRLGLTSTECNPRADTDGIAAIRVAEGAAHQEYIPYTNRALAWHTDGYYNTAENSVRSVIMHCVSPAAHGGASHLYDPELVYIALRDEEPDYVAALMSPRAMTIPANVRNGTVLRPARAGPVFTADRHGRALHTRYTARKRYVHWRDDETTREAVQYVEWHLSNPVPRAFRITLAAGQGILCNNVLHARESFRDEASAGRCRLLWRARYRERVSST